MRRSPAIQADLCTEYRQSDQNNDQIPSQSKPRNATKNVCGSFPTLVVCGGSSIHRTRSVV